MRGRSRSTLIQEGIQAADGGIYHEDDIWSGNSSDKPDIARMMFTAIRLLLKDSPLNRKLSVLSIGSGPAPQLPVLSAVFQGGVNLLDVDEHCLDEIDERRDKLNLPGITTIRDDYRDVLLRERDAAAFHRDALNGKMQHLVTLHHSLYYSSEEQWLPLFQNLKRHVLSDRGAIHAVLMHPRSNDKNSTTWLYNHFAGKFKGAKNNQDLTAFTEEVRNCRTFSNCDISCTTNRIRFFVNDFSKLMAVVWMILLYPEVHRYSKEQREEITEYIHDHLWIREEPLVQHQDHLIITPKQ